MSDLIIIKHGYRADLPTLEEGELGLATDEEELYGGTLSGNVKLTSKSEINEINTILTNHALKISTNEQDIDKLNDLVGEDLTNKLAEKVDTDTLATYQVSVDKALNDLIAKNTELENEITNSNSSYVHDTNSEINQHINNEDIHVTKTNKDNWDTNVLNTNNHIANNEIHVNKDDKDSWNRIDEVIHLLDVLVTGAAITDETGVNIVTETSEVITA